jgi:PHD/YefM family antitoxin component YafN of YafNO toxin-antitoxin module
MQKRSTHELSRITRDILDEVLKTGEPVEIQRYRKPVAFLVSTEDWAEFSTLRQNIQPLTIDAIQNDNEKSA